MPNSLCPNCGKNPRQDCGYGDRDIHGDFDCLRYDDGRLCDDCPEVFCDECKGKKQMSELSEMTEQEFDKYMCEKYPKIFVERNLSPTESCMHWGFGIGPGWYKLLDKLCEKLTFIEEQTGIEIIATQVKEKFGGLRFYVVLRGPSTADNIGVWEDIIYDVIAYAEQYSLSVCEICGKYGKIRDDLGWVKTLCDIHYKEHKEKCKKK